MQSLRRLRAVATLVALAGCSEGDPALRVGATLRPTYEPMYLARQLGRYHEHRVLLIDFSSSVEVMRAYRNGVIDVAALTADEALVIAETEPGKHRIIAAVGISKGIDSILVQAAHTQFSQLKGLRIGVEPNSLGAYVLSRALRAHGMSIRDVQPVPLSFEQHVAAFESGAVDAIVTYEPNRSSLLASGAQEVFSSREIPGEVIDVILTRADVLARRRRTLSHFLRGWFAGEEFLRDRSVEAARFAAQHEHVAVDSYTASLQGLEYLNRERSLQLMSDRSAGLAKSLAELSDRMRDGGLLHASIDTTALLERVVLEHAAQ